MNSFTLRAVCPADEFSRIETLVRAWPGVEAVGSIRTKGRNRDTTDVFIKFDSEDALKDSYSLVRTVSGLSLIDDKQHKKHCNTQNKSRNTRHKNFAAELLNFGVYEKYRSRSGNYGKSKMGKNQKQEENKGWKGQNASGHSSSKKKVGQSRFVIPSVRVSVALADNIPFNMTNVQLAEVFSQFGCVLDINRYELMAMIFYDSPEAVMRCIEHLNGRVLKENVITVSSGTEFIPAPAALQMGAYFLTNKQVKQ